VFVLHIAPNVVVITNGKVSSPQEERFTSLIVSGMKSSRWYVKSSRWYVKLYEAQESMAIGPEFVSNLTICFSTPNVRLMFVGTICFAGNANRGIRARRENRLKEFEHTLAFRNLRPDL